MIWYDRVQLRSWNKIPKTRMLDVIMAIGEVKKKVPWTEIIIISDKQELGIKSDKLWKRFLFGVLLKRIYHDSLKGYPIKIRWKGKKIRKSDISFEKFGWVEKDERDRKLIESWANSTINLYRGSYYARLDFNVSLGVVVFHFIKAVYLEVEAVKRYLLRRKLTKEEEFWEAINEIRKKQKVEEF